LDFNFISRTTKRNKITMASTRNLREVMRKNLRDLKIRR
jgi:hypothetical protein